MDDEELHRMKKKCLVDMTEVYDKHEKAVAEAGGDPEEFAMLVLEQWRPW